MIKELKGGLAIHITVVVEPIRCFLLISRLVICFMANQYPAQKYGFNKALLREANG